MDENNETPEYGSAGYRMLTWQDRLMQTVPSVLSISQSLELNINEKILGWLRTISQDKEVTAIAFGEGPGERYLFPAVADTDNKNLAPLTFGKTGKTGRASGGLGFTTDALPLLAEGTLHLAIRPHKLPDGKMCLAADIKKPVLARDNHKQNVVTRARAAKRKASAAKNKNKQAKPNPDSTQSTPPTTAGAQSIPPNTTGTQSAPPNTAGTQSAPPNTSPAQSAPSHQSGTDPKPQ